MGAKEMSVSLWRQASNSSPRLRSHAPTMTQLTSNSGTSSEAASWSSSQIPVFVSSASGVITAVDVRSCRHDDGVEDKSTNLSSSPATAHRLVAHIDSIIACVPSRQPLICESRISSAGFVLTETRPRQTRKCLPPARIRG